MASSADYAGQFGRLLELTDIVDRFGAALHRAQAASPAASAPHLREGLERVWDVRAAEWERLEQSGVASREVYRRVMEHRQAAPAPEPEPEAEAEP